MHQYHPEWIILEAAALCQYSILSATGASAHKTRIDCVEYKVSYN